MVQNENIPLYFRAYQKLKQNILSGEFEKGAKIGIIDELAKTYGVAQETMRRALYLLESEGLLIRKQGLGTIIPETANLGPIEMAKLISLKKVVLTAREADVVIISAEWVTPGRRLMRLYNLEEDFPDCRVHKIFHRVNFKEQAGLRAIITHYVSEAMNEALASDKTTPPYEVLMKLAEWVDVNSLKLKELLRPCLCTEENADLLGLPDGSPVFYQEFSARNKQDLCHYWEVMSTANVHTHEVEWV